MTSLGRPAVVPALPDTSALGAVQQADVAGPLDGALHQQRVRRHPLDENALLVRRPGRLDLNVVRAHRLPDIRGRNPRGGGLGRQHAARCVRAAVVRPQREFVQRRARELEVRWVGWVRLHGFVGLLELLRDGAFFHQVDEVVGRNGVWKSWHFGWMDGWW